MFVVLLFFVSGGCCLRIAVVLGWLVVGYGVVTCLVWLDGLWGCGFGMFLWV